MDEDAGIVDSLGFSALDQFLGEFTGDSSIKASNISAALSARDRSHARNVSAVIDADMLYGGRFMDDDDEENEVNDSVELNNDYDEDDEDGEDAEDLSDEDDEEDEQDGAGEDDDDEEDDDYREAADAAPIKKASSRSAAGATNDASTSATGRKSKQQQKRRSSGSLHASVRSSGPKKRGRKTKADNWEDEIDRELDEEDRLLATNSALALPVSGLPPLVPMSRTRMRGEEDDFDGDGDDEEHLSANAKTNQAGSFGLALPSMAAPTTARMFGLPPPAEAGEHSAWRLPSTTLLPAAVPGLINAIADDDEEELTEDDRRDLARQQALLQAARWRQQQVERQAENDEVAVGTGEFRSAMIDAQTLYPSFAPGKILDFTALFTPRPRKRARIGPSAELYTLPDVSDYSMEHSTRDFRALKPILPPTAINQLLQEAKLRGLEEADTTKSGDVKTAYQEMVKIANTTGWQIPFDLDDGVAHVVYGDWDDEVHLRKPETATQQTEHSRFPYRNPSVEAGDWVRSVIFSSNSQYEDFTRLQLSLDDALGPASIPAPQKPPKLKPSILVNNSSTLDSYNLSNDKLYEVRREQKRTVRQTFGHIEVQHSYPAMKLQFPWYKTQLSKNELRSFHRLPIQFPTNIPLSFAKVRSAKRKKDKTGRKLKKDSIGAEAFRTMGDLSLRDTGNFVLWEFSEENPPIIANVGMGSIIVNYYRKTDVGDMYIPKTDLGEPVLLNPSDESPFLRFGQVEPGQMIPALYNNLIRAPLFRHRPYDTDFLAIKTTVDGETKFFVRDIANMFVVGQTYPLTEVPGPQARKLTATAKHRLQSITYKLVSKNPKKRVKIGKLLKYFPDQSEPQMRQRLKDFMEFNRAGDNQGFWKIKAGKMPDEDELFKLIGPEQIVLSESTQVGQRNLLDAGFTTTVDEDKGKDNEESTLDVRQQLAPWFTTKNFINATQNKAMLKLHGEGDPSSRGEGFSFLRVSMKDIFLRAGEKMEDRVAEIEARPKSAHRYNVAEQQGIYRQEIDRIWKTQYESLSSLYEPAVTEADEVRYREEELKMENAQDLALSALVAEEGMSPNISRDDSPMFGNQSRTIPRVLRIRRLVNGIWRSEIVRDAGVIRGYLRHKQTAEADDDQEPESLIFNGDPEHDAVIRKKLALQLEKLRKNQERRLQRKNAKMGITGDVFLPGGKKVKHETTRRCGNCGQIGHMKTNRKCPKWRENHEANNAEPGANQGASVANPFAVGLPGLGQT